MQAGGVASKSKKAPMVDPNGAKKAKDGGKFGMLSVKAGIDKNPKPTAADRIAGAKMKAKKAKSGMKVGKCKSGC